MVSPKLSRFLSDFTLGFSDGLTVPFALTAGLSSLGRSETVIYAGLAELCAGCISMGIGGYLAARDSSHDDSRRVQSLPVDEEEQGMLSVAGRHSEDETEDEKRCTDEPVDEDEVVLQYLQPLGLPETTVAMVIEAVRSQSGGSGWASERIKGAQASRPENFVEINIIETSRLQVSPMFSGLSISLGYLCGGLMPLLPYFFASSVGRGLLWSIIVCLIALFAFGAGKSWLLGDGQTSRIRCLWEGLQMLLFGCCAAGAAVLCVRLVDQKWT
ncbi:Ccc1 family [Colletotrichum godetiae]|uniref:Ccc1 family n=1 Tax=Colletotrichum godetiae TaxID=1209918 RepID=A0AAJ0AKU8_9PEZI|nr:Ccc1 family [Colletotrichum godetiae]KAK1675134.1 Ccc1 family [Colletotrichum godetiae]